MKRHCHARYKLKLKNHMQRKENLRSQTLDLLRFPLAIVVLMIHVFSPNGFDGQSFTFEEHQLLMGVNQVIDAFFRGQSVPIYYFISGFVFFHGVEMTRKTYVRKFKNRIKSLLIPYLIWNMLAIALALAVNFLLKHYTITDLFSISLSSLLSCFWTYDGFLSDRVLESSQTIFPINIPLWFVRDLIIVVLLTPLLHLLIKKFGKIFIYLLGIFWFITPFLNLQLLGFENAFFFFSWGAYISINRKDMLLVFGRYFKISLCMFLLLGVLYIAALHYWINVCSFIKQLNVLFVLLFAYNLAAWLLNSGHCRVNKFLASASFFVYITHYLVAGKIQRLLIISFAPANDLSILVVNILTIALTLAIVLGVFYSMQRYTPSLLKVIAGRK